jgi:hypothetical protein
MQRARDVRRSARKGQGRLSLFPVGFNGQGINSSMSELWYRQKAGINTPQKGKIEQKIPSF